MKFCAPCRATKLTCVQWVVQTNSKNSLCIQICIKVTLLSNSLPFVEVFLKPRLTLTNQLPIYILFRTPMKYTFSPPNHNGICSLNSFDLQEHVTHRLDPEQAVEVFTAGHSVTINTIFAEWPCADNVTGWTEEWIDIPLGLKRRLNEPLRGLFPFVRLSVCGESTFSLVDSPSSLDKDNNKSSSKGEGRQAFHSTDSLGLCAKNSRARTQLCCGSYQSKYV